MDDSFIRTIELGGEKLTVYASASSFDKSIKYWSLGVASGNSEVGIKSMSKNAPEQLRELRDVIDEALKFYEKPTTNNVKKGKKNDGKQKKHVD